MKIRLQFLTRQPVGTRFALLILNFHLRRIFEKETPISKKLRFRRTKLIRFNVDG